MSANIPVPVSFDALAVGRSSTSPFITVFETRNPTSNDVNYQIQQRWFNTANSSEWILVSYSIVNGTKTATWDEITGAGVAVEHIFVDASTPPGTNPVLTDGSSNITITGGQVAAGTTTNVIRTDSLAAHAFTIEVQRTQAVASSTIGANGVCHFDSSDFTVDSNGFVSINGTETVAYTNVTHAMSPYTVLATDFYISVDCSGGVVTLRFPNAPTAKRSWIVKDRTGSAATSNITLTTSGGVVTFDGVTSFTMNSNYQAINLLANATPTYEVY